MAQFNYQYGTTDADFLRAMPHHFTRQELLKKVVAAGYSLSKAGQIIERAIHAGTVERSRPGHFSKVAEMQHA